MEPSIAGQGFSWGLFIAQTCVGGFISSFFFIFNLAVFATAQGLYRSYLAHKNKQHDDQQTAPRSVRREFSRRLGRS